MLVLSMLATAKANELGSDIRYRDSHYDHHSRTVRCILWGSSVNMLKLLKMILNICNHENRTWPISVINGIHCDCPYEACLDCGAEFEYDLRTMKLGKEIRRAIAR
jgi:hypothetical protein